MRLSRTSSRERVQLRGGRRIGVQVPLAVADDADLRRDVEARAEHELGRAAADVDHQVLAGRTAVGGARVGQPRLVVAAQDLRP